MKVPITQLQEGENKFDLSSQSQSSLCNLMQKIAKAGYVFRSDLTAHITLTKLEPDYYLKGTVAYSIEMTCDRCAESFPFATTHPFEVALAHLKSKTSHPYEPSDKSKEPDRIFFEGNEIDFEPILEEQFYLSMPYHSLCKMDCKGVCQQCGKNLNREQCGCKNPAQSTPFAQINGFKAR
ncbi:MAG: DUF177 domain-containing protein [Deltaproteobacteria bacterium]|nr:DUF177 domain-containing protein [Deltaproteobacteria bacterium]